MTDRQAVTFIAAIGRVTRAAALLASACLIVGGLGAAPAAAEVSTSGLTFAPSDPGAAVRPNVDISFNVHAVPDTDDIKDLTLDLPVGMMGDAQNVTKCSESQLTSDSCPATSRVGTASSRVTALILGLNPSGDIYAMPPQGTEAARIGIVLRPGIVAATMFVRGSITLREGDYGLRTTLEPLPRQATGVFLLGTVDIRIDGMDMTLFGQTSNATKFISAPTSCTPATLRVRNNSYNETSRFHTSTATYTPTNCASVPFTPTVSVGVSPATPDTATQTTIGLAFPPSSNPRVQSQLRNATIDLPPGLEINPAAAGSGLQACPDAAIAVTTAAPVTACPAKSVVGTVTINSPQVGALTGTVYAGQATNSSQLMRLFIVAQRSAAASDVRVKLTGEVSVHPVTGRVTAKLTDIPQVPFSSMSMVLRGGPDALMRTPRTCGTAAMTTVLSPWSGTAPTSPTAGLVTSGCAESPSFAPTVAVSATPTSAGASSAVAVTLTRPDGAPRLQRARISLPNGLMGRLTGVPTCALDDARAATCSEESVVGSARVSAGSGSAPLSLPGTLHLTPPTSDGLAGLALIVDAKVGPLDLGTIAVLMEMRLRAGGDGIDVVTEELPQRIKGIALDLRTVEMTIDRPGFLLNPTACSATALRADLDSDLGTAASASSPFAATGCDTLTYDTSMEIKLAGELGKNGHPTVTATMSAPEGSANTRAVTMLLPDAMAPDADRLGVACPVEKALIHACPDAARVGQARAMTRALPTALEGGVYLVTAPGAILPELVVRLKGPTQIDLRGTVDFVKNRTRVSFPSIPDVPIERFSLTLEGAARGLVVNSDDLCTSVPKLDLELTAHSGAKRTQVAAPGLDGCGGASGAPKVTVGVRSARSGSPTLSLSATSMTPMRTLTLTLPAGFSVKTKAVRRLTKVVGADRVTLRPSTRRLRLDFGPKGATRVRVAIAKGAIAVSPAARKTKRHTFGVTTTPVKDRASATKVRAESRYRGG